MNSLQEIIIRIKNIIDTYEDKLQKNEMLVRYALVDPLLRAIGWDVNDPEQVMPEYGASEGKPDYALFTKVYKEPGKPIAFIETKALNGLSDDKIKDKLKYSFDEGVKYTIITDGNKWIVYDTLKQIEWNKKDILRWVMSEEDPISIAFKLLAIANTPNFCQVDKMPKPIFP